MSEVRAYVKMTLRRAEKRQDVENISRTEMVITRGGNEELTIKRIRSLPKKGCGTYTIHWVLEAVCSAPLKSWIINEDLTIEVQDEEDLTDIGTDITKRMNISAYNWNNLHQDGESKP
jgi:hypothetical protein